MAAGGRLRTGRTWGGRGGDFHVQGQALVFEGEGLRLERHGEEASTEIMQQQHRLLLSWGRDDTGRQTIAAIIPDLLASRTLGKNRTFLAKHIPLLTRLALPGLLGFRFA
jgi:hypothetical protein